MNDAANLVTAILPNDRVHGKETFTRRDSGQETKGSSFDSYVAAQRSALSTKQNQEIANQLAPLPMALYFNPAISIDQTPIETFSLEELSANLEGILSEFSLDKGLAPIEITSAGFSDGDLKTQILTILDDLKGSISEGGQAVLSMLSQQKQEPTQAFPALSLLGSTPQDITKALEGGTPEEIENLLLQVEQLAGQIVQITVPENLNALDINALLNEQSQTNLGIKPSSSPDEIRDALSNIADLNQLNEGDLSKIASALNSITTDGDGDIVSGRNAWLNKAVNQSIFGEQNGPLMNKAAPANFAEALKSQAQLQGMNSGEPMTSASAAALNSDGAFDVSQLDGSWLIDGETLDPAVLEQLGHRGMINPQVTGLGNQTQLSLNAPAAGASHPATETVAAMIKSSANGGDTSEIEIELDPPELGKLKIRLEFGADQSVKAHLTIDKPETYQMLQRDAHILEKALEDAGLNTDSDSLSFEMAEQGTDDNGHHGGSSHGHGSGQENPDGGLEIIESTMNWYVDPDTGAQRYDLLV